MRYFLCDVFVGALIVCIVLYALFISPLMLRSWLNERDCRLINQTECEWQMVPVMEKE